MARTLLGSDDTEKLRKLLLRFICSGPSWNGHEWKCPGCSLGHREYQSHYQSATRRQLMLADHSEDCWWIEAVRAVGLDEAVKVLCANLP